ncbi:MAG: tail fiber domain-containing protein, partial [Hymenobacteraceae bacterium]|nr:tail fiber domain-containing protein [Hymenobacteraceae bacterium]
ATTSQITDDGTNVGIGTAGAAAYKLDVAGDVNASGMLRLGGLPMMRQVGTNTLLVNAGNATMTGDWNLAVGPLAGYSLASGGFNTMIGLRAGQSLTLGNYNVMVGDNAGTNANGANNPAGNQNVLLGSYTYSSGSSSVALGADATVTGSNSAAIGVNANAGRDNAIVLGRVVAVPTAANHQPNIGIGTATPDAALTVKSNLHPVTIPGQEVVVADISYTNSTTGTTAADVTAVRGTNIAQADGYGFGGSFEGNYIGVSGVVSTTNSTFSTFGVRGDASAGGTRAAYGIHGSGTGSLSYGVYSNGNMAYTGTLTNTSDRKFKRNIQPLPTGTLGRLMQLRPVSYEMRRDEFPAMGLASGPQIGVIAQELAEVFPELVKDEMAPGKEKTDAPTPYKGVNYTGLTPILIKAVQEQQVLIEAQKSRIETLEARLLTLEARIK